MADTPERIARSARPRQASPSRRRGRAAESRPGRNRRQRQDHHEPRAQRQPQPTANHLRTAGPSKPADIPRLWLYHQARGPRDHRGRTKRAGRTVFDALPETLPRVMSIGRLDIGSEGLLLLTNDGGIKRRLELPSTGWLRKYRVRIHGTPEDSAFAPLRRGLTVDGERFRPMDVVLDRQQGANAWVTVGIREGRNREIRRAMEAIGLPVNRLIRISYGAVPSGRPQARRGLRSEGPRPARPARPRGDAAPRGRQAAKALTPGLFAPILYGKPACLPIWSKAATGNPTPNATPRPRDPPGRRPLRARGLYRLGISKARRRAPGSGRQDNADAAGRLFRADRFSCSTFPSWGRGPDMSGRYGGKYSPGGASGQPAPGGVDPARRTKAGFRAKPSLHRPLPARHQGVLFRAGAARPVSRRLGPSHARGLAHPRGAEGRGSLRGAQDRQAPPRFPASSSARFSPAPGSASPASPASARPRPRSSPSSARGCTFSPSGSTRCPTRGRRVSTPSRPTGWPARWTRPEQHLAGMTEAIKRARDPKLERRVETFQATARRMFRSVENDPRDLVAARRYLGVYLLGAKDATVRFADLYAQSGKRAGENRLPRPPRRPRTELRPAHREASSRRQVRSRHRDRGPAREACPRGRAEHELTPMT